MITALLPRDKTYNVAAISDKSVSLGGGATQILFLRKGASGATGKTFFVTIPEIEPTDAAGAGVLGDRVARVLWARARKPYEARWSVYRAALTSVGN